MATNAQTSTGLLAKNHEEEKQNDVKTRDSVCLQDNVEPDYVKPRNVIRLCRFIVARPKFAFGIAFSMHILMLLLTGVLFVSGYDILPVNFGEVPLDLSEDPVKLRADAWKYARENEEVSQLSGGQLKRGIKYQSVFLVYEGDNVFTRENLLSLKKYEETLFNLSDYQNELCLLQGTANRTCAKFVSILRFFDGTYAAIDPTFYDPNFDNIVGVLYTATMNKKSNALLKFHLGKDAIISANKVYSPYTRSLLFTGWPLEGYKSNMDGVDEQKEKLDKAMVDTFLDTFNEKYQNGIGEMKFYYFSTSLWTADLQKQVVYDMMLAVASLCFIFLFCWFQTGSLWITSFGIFGIFSSFNITNLLYRIVLDYRYFGVFHVMSIFIILGIGSDNIFVFMDTWKQSAGHKYIDLAHRLSDVYRKSAKTMFVTSITTVVAFLSNAPSPLLSISSFGIFSAVLVFVNYLSVILFFPTVVFCHHLSRKGRCCCCSLHCSHEDSNVDNNLLEESVRQPSRRKRKTLLEYVIQFFDVWFFKNIVIHKYVRWLVLILSVAIIGVAIGFATQLEPDKEQTKIWRSDTNWAKFNYLSNNVFQKSQEDLAVLVHIIWGLEEQDRSECHHSDFKCKGKTVFDRSFDLNPPPCQTAMLNFCKELRAPSNELEDSLKLRRNEISGEVEIKCVFERMDEYLKEEAKKPKYPNGSDFSFVINSNKMQTLMKYNRHLYNTSLLSDSYYRYFEIGLGYFITDGGSDTYASTYDFKNYESLLGGVLDPTLPQNASRNTYLQGNSFGHRLAYVAIAVNTTLRPFSLGYEEGLPIYRNWNNYVQNKMKRFPSSCNNAFQATVTYDFNVWHWVKVQEILVLNALTGIVIGISLALIILIITSTNVIVGFLATFVIALITCTVLGIINIIGWKLGPLESLNLTLIVGLAVDYVVHLAEGYMQLQHGTRSNKVRYALSHVGVSVLSGACSTLGASIFMFAAKIMFFVQFGIFIFVTIGFSILYSLFLFPTVMALVGPENQTGSILPLGRKIKEILRGQTNKHTDCSFCDGKGYYEKGKYGDIPLKETNRI